MKRKLGPLLLWQWILIGAAVGGGTVLYRRTHPGAAQTALAAATPSTAQFNPIDPTTGMPVAGGVSSSPIDVDALGKAIAGALPQQPPFGLPDLLSSFAQLETLLAGLTEIGGGGGAAPTSTGPPVDTSPDTPKTHTGAKRPKKPKTGKKPAKPKKTRHAGEANPGHHVTRHGGGKKTASSSAPHNPRQHHNVQAPAHQRHDPAQHPSADHPLSGAVERQVAAATGYPPEADIYVAPRPRVPRPARRSAPKPPRRGRR